MNSIDIAYGVVFQKMKISKDTFEDRLICQKKIYLLQAFGTHLGYTYNWYVRGPYSPSLTNYIYSNLDFLQVNDFSQHKLSETAAKNIDRVNALNEKRRDMSESAWYELLASLLYIRENKQSWGIDDSKDSLFDTLIKYKPQFNREQCQQAYEALEL